ncbi:uncharacterized protein VICG_00702 [Vittaforma corneae ATCC 50505]|uniref:Uncharacterized protein n=1 Tax=Vittaforma corneae (strain ATCC 50505) TaxID=993615 RepID=L2GPQ8_VITCO|nr:uncharacterized protein VICG_00702 [Vittaforma corneae ATCC 50505]ELA42302.1 hypothetical protein VICG_00702 [Vittaforma corneae ATCC 50505]
MTHPKALMDDSIENGQEFFCTKVDTMENSNKTGNTILDPLKRTKSFYNSEFIRSNFCPLKLSRSDIKNLSSDFPDQTLGGHRIYREELIDGKLAKVYEYKVKIIKYDNEYLKVEKKVGDEFVQPLIIIENNLIVPFNQNLAIQRKIDVSQDHPLNALSDIGQLPIKRGRPRKYPVGKEPYKKKKYPERNYEIIPESDNLRYQDDYSIKEFDALPFTFSNDYHRQPRSPSPYTNEYYDFQTGQPVKITGSEKSSEQSSIFEIDDHFKDLLSQQHIPKTYAQKGKESPNELTDSYSRDYF